MKMNLFFLIFVINFFPTYSISLQTVSIGDIQAVCPSNKSHKKNSRKRDDLLNSHQAVISKQQALLDGHKAETDEKFKALQKDYADRQKKTKARQVRNVKILKEMSIKSNLINVLHLLHSHTQGTE
jgi:uncharacterized membrane-anchored protein YhcB (DUF1043 family)